MEETLRGDLTNVKHALMAEAQRSRQAFDRELDAIRVDEHQVVLQQLATVLQSQVGRLKKSREILKLWIAQSRCKGWLKVP